MEFSGNDQTDLLLICRFCERIFSGNLAFLADELNKANDVDLEEIKSAFDRMQSYVKPNEEMMRSIKTLGEKISHGTF